jgi:hypothetical protein
MMEVEVPNISEKERRDWISQMEKILGVPIGHQGIIPGTVPIDGTEIVYFCDGSAKGKRFHDLTSHSKPLHAQRGGVTGRGCHLTLPDGSIFHAAGYRGDLAGWRQDIEEGAAAQKILLARIEADKLVISDGRKFALSECTAEFD